MREQWIPGTLLPNYRAPGNEARARCPRRMGGKGKERPVTIVFVDVTGNVGISNEVGQRSINTLCSVLIGAYHYPWCLFKQEQGLRQL